MASFGHLVVLIGLICVLCLLSHATYFKRPVDGRHLGLPFTTNRLSFTFADRIYAVKAPYHVQCVGIRGFRRLLF
jgi:hypothetical protein